MNDLTGIESQLEAANEAAKLAALHAAEWRENKAVKTGSTLAANHLKILDDGVILKSSAVLAGRATAADDPRVARLRAAINAKL